MAGPSCFHQTCLKPSYSLRRQLLLSFGSASLLSLSIVVAVASITANRAGVIVNGPADDLFREQVKRRLVRNSRYVSESLSKYLGNMKGSIQLTTEFVQDRIVGYPEAGWEEDLFVPFKDRETGSNKYPLNTTRLPFDWQFEPINSENLAEHFPDRVGMFETYSGQVGSLSYYFMPGCCDPLDTDPSSPRFYENCTDSNNDVTTGGVKHPSPTNKGLYEKAADIGVFLKAIFEAERDIAAAGVFFINSGASSFVQYPSGVVGLMLPSYISEGCEWMREINPRNGKPFGTEEDIARCPPVGETILPREYNPNARGWFQQMTTNPKGISFQGPLFPNVELPIYLVGQGIFDRKTGNLIGNAVFTIEAETIVKILNSTSIVEQAALSVIRLSDNTVFFDTLDTHNGFQKVTETGFISETNLARLRSGIPDFATTDWTPEGLQESLNANVLVCETQTYSAFLLPPPPDKYDPLYEPEFLVIRAFSNEIFDVTTLYDDNIDNAVAEIFLLSFSIGAFGMALTLVIVYFVSRRLTRPLLWMKQIAWELVNHANERSSNNILFPEDHGMALTTRGCAPTTEITELVREFKDMINGFSGEGAATLAQPDLFEIPNQLTWQSEYQQLYSFSAKAIDDKTVRLEFVDVERSAEEGREERPTETDGDADPSEAIVVPTSIVLAPPKRNLGPNLKSDYREKKRMDSEFGGGNIRVLRSSLFWWLLVLIVLPLILTNTTICWIVSYRIVDSMDDFVNAIVVDSLALELEVLQSSASVKAAEATLNINDILRSLFIMTRVAGWLFFGGVERSDGFSRMEEAAQECRGYSQENICPVYFDFERTPCVCSWHDLTQKETLPCLSINYTDPRYLQHKFFFCQARDADSRTGRRNEAASFGTEGVDDSPANTLFWDDIDAVPGASKGVNASRYETTYDRIRVSSAMSVVEIPVYNFAANLGQDRKFLASSVAFDADGMMSGYRGCEPSHQVASLFQSNDVNRAAVVNPELCPLGKFGYDPRCRDWYATGKRLYLDSRQPAYITAPYLAASRGSSSSATSPIANPTTGEYVGQVLYDFIPRSLQSIFKSLDEPIGFIIAPKGGGTGDDTVILAPEDGGPESLGTSEPNSILDLLFQHDGEASTLRREFETKIRTRMKEGENGFQSFERTTQNGRTETLQLAFRPVTGRVMLPIDPSNFTRGVNRSEILVYSVGLAYREEDIRGPWRNIEDDVHGDMQRLQTIYLLIIGFVSFLFLMFSCYIATNITKPVITLLHIVRSINLRQIEDDIPPLLGGSSEVQQVHNTFSKLYKTVRVSNFAFFSGNLTFAQRIINEALMLYRKIGDEKAIGIACNNLANTFHAMCNVAHVESNRLDGSLPLDCCERSPSLCSVRMAMSLYDEAISVAQFQLGLATSDEEKADFTQQLADRLFNRALFFLLVVNEKCAPPTARATAFSDIERVRRMDTDVKDFWIDRKILLKRSSDYFYRLLRRCLGLLEHYSDEELRQIWNPNELVEDADRFLFAAWDQPSAPLFEQMTRIGRLQQLECVAMRLDICRGRQILAARLAMRMFAEDEYLLEGSFAVSASVLLKLIRDEEDWPGGWTSKTKAVRADLRKMLRTCKATRLDIGKGLVFAIELTDKWRDHQLLEVINARCLQLYDDCCLRDDCMGLVAYTTQGDLNVPVCVKAENEGRQRTSLDLATSTTSEQVSPAFHYALQMLIDSHTSPENDTFVILLSDGKSFDPSTPATFKTQIELMNRNRETKLHMIILGLDLDEDLKAQYKVMCSLSKQSLYVDLNANNVDRAFDEISALIRGETIIGLSLNGVTMEKF